MLSHDFESIQSDEEIRELGIPEEKIEMYRRMRYQNAFSIDTWNLPECTFRSSQLKLSLEEAEALSILPIRRTAEHKKSLSTLAKRLNTILSEQFPNGAFVKLNTRSPKDVPTYDIENSALKTLIKQEISKLPQITDTGELWSFVKATTKILKVCSGKEAVDLLSKSTRVREDLTKMLDFGPKHFNGSIIIREWIDEVADRPEMEFRAFVHEGKLNAITQYFCMAYVQELVDRKEEILGILTKFHDSIKSRIPHPSYVIDFYIKKDNTPLVIELNPFHIGAGAGLFSWNKDREVFLNGPLEFRIVEEECTDREKIRFNIPIKWDKWLIKKYHADWQKN